MKISVIGSGCVGLVSEACFAQMGNRVISVDIDKQKIENLKNEIREVFSITIINDASIISLSKRLYSKGISICV